MAHPEIKTIITKEVIRYIAKEKAISLEDALDLFYTSRISSLLSNDETGLYGESPLYIYSLFQNENN